MCLLASANLGSLFLCKGAAALDHRTIHVFISGRLSEAPVKSALFFPPGRSFVSLEADALWFPLVTESASKKPSKGQKLRAWNDSVEVRRIMRARKAEREGRTDFGEEI